MKNRLFIIVLFVFIFVLVGCKEECIHEFSEPDCVNASICKKCGVEGEKAFGHKDLYWTEAVGSCLEKVEIEYKCGVCNQTLSSSFVTITHNFEDIAILDGNGKRCSECKYTEYNMSKYSEFADNGFSKYGKLSVNGPDLVNAYKEKVQLVGLSTHGLQWFGKYVNYKTIAALRKEFGINTLRLSMYTSELGYCDGGEAVKKALYKRVVDGIEIATSLDMYVIVDWHMVGAEDVNDKNPLYYKDQAIEFFGRISEQFKDNQNILYEIMNEPNGETTWNDCKSYANAVIPVIRKNTDAVVLVGNPKWTSDLESVMAAPLIGHKNIMYTYHFYANDLFSPNEVIDAYESGLPVFISEHGGMNADGNGSINVPATLAWYKALDERNISYVAWNISNSKGDASIIKYASPTMTDFSDENLKEWGIFYKNWLREKFGLNQEN